MSMINKSITITDQQDCWIKEQIEIGRFGDESEAIRFLICDFQLREESDASKLEALRAELIKGEESGFSVEVPQDFFSKLYRS
jgi:antitoxin ParD1/3/4